MKTRAMQILDALHVHYEVREFEEEEVTAAEVAVKLDLPLDMIFKTLVVKGERSGVFLCCIPATHELSLRKAARASDDKTAVMVPHDDVFRLTGYHRGGCSPLGAKKNYPVFIAEEIILLDRVCVSAGMRGMMLLLTPDDLIRAARAAVSDLVEE